MNGRLDVRVLLQVEYSLDLGSDYFIYEEEEGSKEFKYKQPTTIGILPTTDGCTFYRCQGATLNGLTIITTADCYFDTTQRDNIDKLSIQNSDKACASQRELVQLRSQHPTGHMSPVKPVSPGNSSSTPEEYKVLTKSINFLHKIRDTGINLVRLDLPTSRLVLLMDASFANVKGI